MTKNEVVQKLREEAKSNKVADAVFHMWGSRERSRFQVTVAALDYRMKGLGFEYDRNEYTKLLKFLASLGFGRLETDTKGRVLALKEIKLTLQSIGRAAVQGENLEDLKLRNRYSKLIVGPVLPIATSATTVDVTAPKTWGVSVNVGVGKKRLEISVPQDFTTHEIADLLDRLKNGDTNENTHYNGVGRRGRNNHKDA